jgi:hypothetical protein
MQERARVGALKWLGQHSSPIRSHRAKHRQLVSLSRRLVYTCVTAQRAPLNSKRTSAIADHPTTGGMRGSSSMEMAGSPER